MKMCRSEEKRREAESEREAAEKEEERLLGEMKLREHLRREGGKDEEQVLSLIIRGGQRCHKSVANVNMEGNVLMITSGNNAPRTYALENLICRLGNEESFGISGRIKWTSSATRGVPPSEKWQICTAK